jgi:hypothetical protein
MAAISKATTAIPSNRAVLPLRVDEAADPEG